MQLLLWILAVAGSAGKPSLETQPVLSPQSDPVASPGLSELQAQKLQELNDRASRLQQELFQVLQERNQLLQSAGRSTDPIREQLALVDTGETSGAAACSPNPICIDVIDIYVAGCTHAPLIGLNVIGTIRGFVDCVSSKLNLLNLDIPEGPSFPIPLVPDISPLRALVGAPAGNCNQYCYLAYCNAYLDLRNAFCNGATCSTAAHIDSCRSHWNNCGKTEGRIPNPEHCVEICEFPVTLMIDKRCSDEGGTCECNGIVRFGHGINWNSKLVLSGSIQCNNQVFGDPKPGFVKSCRCSGLSGVNQCAEALVTRVTSNVFTLVNTNLYAATGCSLVPPAPADVTKPDKWAGKIVQLTTCVGFWVANQVLGKVAEGMQAVGCTSGAPLTGGSLTDIWQQARTWGTVVVNCVVQKALGVFAQLKDFVLDSQVVSQFTDLLTCLNKGGGGQPLSFLTPALDQDLQTFLAGPSQALCSSVQPVLPILVHGLLGTNETDGLLYRMLGFEVGPVRAALDGVAILRDAVDSALASPVAECLFDSFIEPLLPAAPPPCAFGSGQTSRYLAGYAGGSRVAYKTLLDAQRACCLRTDCGGVTLEPPTSDYTLRAGAALLIDLKNGETSWLKLFAWQQEAEYEFARGCDLPRFDLAVVGGIASYQDCAARCAQNADCTNFVHTSSQCYLKRGSLNKAQAVRNAASTCGIMQRAGWAKRSARNDYGSSCEAWTGTEEEAMAACERRADCSFIHDYDCDGQSWRVCTGPVDAMATTQGPACLREASVWTVVAKEDENGFNNLFRASPQRILRRTCPNCAQSHQEIFYRRKRQDTWNAYQNMWRTWSISGAGNLPHTDFDVYSSLADALADRNPWQFFNGDDSGVGFPRDSSPSTATADQWNSLTRGGQQVQFSVYQVAHDLVTCSFTIDNSVLGVWYNGVDITSTVTGHLHDWTSTKTVHFHEVSGARLAVKGSNAEATTGPSTCSTAGFLLSCSSANANSPWHGLVSDLSGIVRAFGTSSDESSLSPARPPTAWTSNFFDYSAFTGLCASSSGFYNWNTGTAQKVWAEDKFAYFLVTAANTPSLVAAGGNGSGRRRVAGQASAPDAHQAGLRSLLDALGDQQHLGANAASLLETTRGIPQLQQLFTPEFFSATFGCHLENLRQAYLAALPGMTKLVARAISKLIDPASADRLRGLVFDMQSESDHLENTLNALQATDPQVKQLALEELRNTSKPDMDWSQLADVAVSWLKAEFAIWAFSAKMPLIDVERTMDLLVQLADIEDILPIGDIAQGGLKSPLEIIAWLDDMVVKRGQLAAENLLHPSSLMPGFSWMSSQAVGLLDFVVDEMDAVAAALCGLIPEVGGIACEGTVLQVIKIVWNLLLKPIIEAVIPAALVVVVSLLLDLVVRPLAVLGAEVVDRTLNDPSQMQELLDKLPSELRENKVLVPFLSIVPQVLPALLELINQVLGETVGPAYELMQDRYELQQYALRNIQFMDSQSKESLKNIPSSGAAC
eukprot:g10498.t1